MKYSIVVPVYNRPDEIKELLDSLTKQSFQDFEVIIVEDGSSVPCEEIVRSFDKKLHITYYFKENSGQGMSRNFGFEQARGDYYIVFDSDCIIPPQYLKIVDEFLKVSPLDAFGGPDKAHPSFTNLQKAISYSMTSLFTTGGIRGRKKHIGSFHPRSFNMGISKEVYKKTGGYLIPRLGEDIEFSIRIGKNGFTTGLIPGAYVYHKRRTSLHQFWKQLHFFGRARINIGRFYPSEIKIVHLFPLLFTCCLFVWLVGSVTDIFFFFAGLTVFGLWSIAIFIDSTIKNRNVKVGILSVAAAFIQLISYGLGFFQESMKFKKSPFEASAGR